jgi:hypothetical protein
MIDLGTVNSVEQFASRLCQELDQRFSHFPDIDHVIIERQPKARSIMMVAIQMFLCMYFTPRAKKVNFASACRKLDMNFLNFPRIVSQEPAKKYAANKAYAIAAANKYLSVMKNNTVNDMIKFKKKDDVADAFLQAVAFIENDGVCSRPRHANHAKQKRQKKNL